MQADLNLNKLANSELDGKGNFFSKLKIDILAVLSIVCALFFGWFLSKLIALASWQYFGIVLVSGILFLIIFLYKAIFVKEPRVAAFMVFLDVAALLIFFFKFAWALGFVFVVIYLLLYFANRDGRWFIDNNLKINFWKVSQVVLPKALISLFLIPSVFVPLNYQVQNQEFPLPQEVFKAVINYSSKFVNIFIPGLNLNNSIEEETSKLISDKVRRNEQLGEFTPGMKKQIVEEGQKGLYSQISDWLGMKINPSAGISETLYASLRQKFTMQSSEIKSLIFLLIGLIIFLSLASLLWPIRIVITIIAWVGYELLISFGFARITNEDVAKEVITVD